MNARQHTDGPDGPDTDDLGYRDDAEERAYERAQGGPAADERPPAPGEDDPRPDGPPAEPPHAAEGAVDAQAEPDDGEPANAG